MGENGHLNEDSVMVVTQRPASAAERCELIVANRKRAFASTTPPFSFPSATQPMFIPETPPNTPISPIHQIQPQVVIDDFSFNGSPAIEIPPTAKRRIFNSGSPIKASFTLYPTRAEHISPCKCPNCSNAINWLKKPLPVHSRPM